MSNIIVSHSTETARKLMADVLRFVTQSDGIKAYDYELRMVGQGDEDHAVRREVAVKGRLAICGDKVPFEVSFTLVRYEGCDWAVGPQFIEFRAGLAFFMYGGVMMRFDDGDFCARPDRDAVILRRFRAWLAEKTEALAA